MSNNDKIPDNNFGNFERIFQDNFSSLVRFAMTIVDSQEIAEDIVQEVFITIWEKKKHVAFRKNINGYLFISVRNNCFDFVKREAKKSDKIIELIPQSFDLYDSTTVEESERNKIIFEAIETLSTKGKIVLKLICFDNLKYKEVAEELDISVDTVKYHFTTSLKFLRQTLTKDHFILFLQFSQNKKM